MNTILVLAGSFCPIHNSHISTLVLAKQHLEEKYGILIKKAYLVPSHKFSLIRKLRHELISSFHRKELCKLATKNYDWIDVFTDLIDSNENFGISKAVKMIKDNHNDCIVRQVCGADSVIVHRKTKPEPVCVINRHVEQLELNNLRTKYIVWEDCLTNISSSIIRHQICNNLSIVDWVSEDCREYINCNKYDFSLECNNLIARLKDTEITLGVGAQSSVRLMLLYSNPVAVKVIKFDKMNTKDDFNRELTLLKALASADSKYTTRLLGEYSNDTFGCFVFEYGTPYLLNLDDNTFRTKRVTNSEDFDEFFNMFEKVTYEYEQQTYSMELNDKKRYCADLINAMMEIHRAGILHRDIKTENLIIVSGRLKVCDFGVSQYEKDKKKIPRGHMRQYPPESICRYSKHIYDKISEIYMLCATLYNVMYNRSIYFDLGNDIGEIIKKQDTKKVPECKYIDGKIEKYIELGLNYNRENRPTLNQLCEVFSSHCSTF